jgi:glycosyltransferase involved in cell wall biosynthesis
MTELMDRSTTGVSRSSGRPLRIAVDARLSDAENGGVASVIIGLADGLSRLETGDEEYVFLVPEGQDAWLRPYVNGPCRTLAVPATVNSRRHLKDTIARAAPFARRAWQRMPPRVTGIPGVPRSNGMIEVAGIDLVHFVPQSAFLTGIPSIYHPHDLQHLHHPQFFSPKSIAIRRSHYQAFADQATMVAVASAWTKLDVVRHLRLADSKVVVVPLAPPLAAVPEPPAAEAAVIANRLGLPPRFLLYPARTWPHKNHAVLIEAAALLRRSQRMDVSLVFTGHRTPEADALDARAVTLGVNDLVTWTGFLEPRELRAVYALCDGVVIPSLFEAASAPLWEAWLAGKPAACSDVTSLPDQAGDAAIVFDAISVDSVTDAMARLWSSEELRERLGRRGASRVRGFTWDRTARTFRAHYRRICDGTVSSEDGDLIAAGAGI